MKSIEFHSVPFDGLKREQLYEALRLRSEVFVVEQDCVYQDIDRKDYIAIHVLMYEGTELVGYTRLFGPGDYFDLSSIGRVVVSPGVRGKGYGKILMEETLREAYKRFGRVPIDISAQQYLIKFYNDLGFEAYGEGYLEDGIPHIRMIRAAD